MALRGEAYKKTFTLIPQGLTPQDTIEYLAERDEKCCYTLLALATDENTDPLQNDIHSFYFGYSNVITSSILKLYKNGIYLGELSSLGYGTSYPFGFHEDDGKRYVGFKLNWRDVLIAEGEGNYHVVADSTTLMGTSYVEESFHFCLMKYNTARANGTIRFDFTHNGIIGNRDNDRDTISFKGLEWYNNIRVYGIVNKETTPFESEQIQYNNGRRIDVSSQQDPEYQIQINMSPYYLHKYLRTDVLQADDIYVTDYNANCPLKPFINQNLKHKGSYEPNWLPKTKRAGVYITMVKTYNNLRKKFC